MAKAATVDVTFQANRDGQAEAYRRGAARLPAKLVNDAARFEATMVGQFGPALGPNAAGNPTFRDARGGGIVTVYVGGGDLANRPCWMR